MKEKEERVLGQAGDNLRAVLDIHGYGFQEAVKHRAIELASCGGTTHWKWKFFNSELPVSLRGDHTHIDLILTAWTRRRNRHSGYYLVGECKRVNPAKGYWCFVKTRKNWLPQPDGYLQFDHVLRFGKDQFISSTRSVFASGDVYDLGFEIKTDVKGDPCASPDKSPINAAVAQVFRSVGGFIDYIGSTSSEPDLLEIDKGELIIPVIFTTAELFVSQVDLGTANLKDGRLPASKVDLERRPWIWFNVNRTANFRPSMRFSYDDVDEDRMPPRFREFARTVVIVNGESLDDFLTHDWNEIFIDHK